MNARLIDYVFITTVETERRNDMSVGEKRAYVLGYMHGIIEGTKHVETIMQPQHTAFQQQNLERAKTDVLRIGEIITACAMEPVTP